MLLEDALYLIEARGLNGEAARALALGAKAWGGEGTTDSAAPALAQAEGRRRALTEARGCGFWDGRAIAWPDARLVRALARALGGFGARVTWRGAEGYPEKIETRLAAEAPPWLLVAGDAARLRAPACAMIGSRQTPEPFLDAARRLAGALAQVGVAVVSGLAEGADRAAHGGAIAAGAGGPAGAGTIAIPARGLLRTDLLGYLGLRGGEARERTDARAREEAHDGAGTQARAARAVTWLGLGRPCEPFHAGMAIRRNALIAAMGEVLVLVASDLKGGSWHALRWALEHRVPIWCLESTARATPRANAYLIRKGLAEGLAIGEDSSRGAERIASRIEILQSDGSTPSENDQLDLLNLSK